jgi:eukaryotic-like serine/threonine-protein kinase
MNDHHPDRATSVSAPPPRFSAALKGTALVVFAISLIILLRILVRPTIDPSNRTIVVAPFENLGDTADAYFAEGVTDDIADAIARVPGVKVIGRDGVRGVTVAGLRPRELAATLGAQYVLTGTVQWTHASGDAVDGASRVVVAPVLMEASAGERVWGQSIEQRLGDLARVPASIAERVAEALALSVSPAQLASLAPGAPTVPVAHVLQLRARRLLGQRGLANARLADTLFRQAIAVDSSAARAWAGLAESQLQRRSYLDTTRSAAAFSDASMRAAERALSLDSLSPDVRLAYARSLAGQYRFDAALQAADRAIALDSASSLAWGLKAELLSVLERLPEAGDAARRAVEDDRLSPIAHATRAGIFLALGVADSAVTSAERAAALDPGEPRWSVTLRNAYVAGGRVDDAVRQCEGSGEGWPCKTLYTALGGDSTARGAALAWLAAAPANVMAPSARAGLFAQLGDRAAAFVYLQRAVADRDAALLVNVALPWMQRLRDDARWAPFRQSLRADVEPLANAKR